MSSNVQGVVEKDNLEVKAKVKGQPEPTVTWYLAGRELATSPRVKILKAEDVHTVAVSQMSSIFAGIYKCVATNKFGSVEHSATVTILGRLIQLG